MSIDEEAADEVFEALSSRTARTMYASLHESPATASDLAETADTTLQNVRYHLDKLIAAQLVEEADTWYSDRGREMTVYAPADTALVMLSGEGSAETTLKTLLKNLIGGVGVLAVASVLFDRLVRIIAPGRGVPNGANQSTPTGSTVATPSPSPSGPSTAPTPTPEFIPVTKERTVILEATKTSKPGTGGTPDGGVVPFDGGPVLEVFGVGLSPGTIFFIGGLFVLMLAIGWQYSRSTSYQGVE